MAFNPEDLINNLFERLGAKPEKLTIPNVLLRKGDSIEVYSIGNVPGCYISEKEARDNLNQASQLYKLEITRIE